MPQASVITGFSEGELMKAALDKACQSKALSRENMLDGHTGPAEG